MKIISIHACKKCHYIFDLFTLESGWLDKDGNKYWAHPHSNHEDFVDTVSEYLRKIK